MFSTDNPIAANNPMRKVSFEQFLQLHLRQKATEVGSELRVEFYSGDLKRSAVRKRLDRLLGSVSIFDDDQ